MTREANTPEKFEVEGDTITFFDEDGDSFNISMSTVDGIRDMKDECEFHGLETDVEVIETHYGSRVCFTVEGFDMEAHFFEWDVQALEEEINRT